MKLKPFLFTLLICFIVSTGFAQQVTIEGEFRSPLDIPLVLSGTFAELRSNHFHGGIDIKTNGKTGYKVYATKEGFISRIKVAPGGYGHALYIQHPNGYTTVYGHLKRYNDKIASYVKQQQYAKQSFGVDLYLSPGQIPVKNGEVVAYSGNTGSSGGPHLHYEIRKTNGQVPINPLLYTKVRDDIKPTIYGVGVQTFGDKNDRQLKQATYISGGLYKVTDTIVVHDTTVGVSIKAVDKLNGANNSNGFVSLKCFVDGALNYEYSKDEMPFDKSRYINAHIDYAAKKLGNGTYVNCFKLPGNQLNIYSPQANDGRIWLSQYPVRKISIEVCDFAGNESKVDFVVKYEDDGIKNDPAFKKYMPSNDYNLFGEHDIRVEIPRGALYDNINMTYERSENAVPNYPTYSALHQVHNETVPLHKFMIVEVEANNFPQELRSKALMGNLDRKGNIDVNTGKWIGNFFQVKTRNFGQFFITTDTKKPTIKQYKAPANNDYSPRTHMMFKISDDLAGVKSYRATVDGQWVLMQYDPKRSLLFHEFDDRISKGNHTLQLRVTDYVGNEETMSFDFIR